jgi:hypothetical protein
VIARPSYCTASARQELIRSPSANTVQAPQVPLIVLAVAILECGSGLALAVAGALKLPASAPPERLVTEQPLADLPDGAGKDTPDHSTRAGTLPEPAVTGVSGGGSGRITSIRGKVMAIIREAGGTIRTDQQTLAALAGVSQATVNRTVASLQAEGAITKRASATGSVLSIA